MIENVSTGKKVGAVYGCGLEANIIVDKDGERTYDGKVELLMQNKSTFQLSLF